MSRSRIAVAIPTIVPHGLLERCLTSVFGQEQVTADVLLVQNGRDVAATCARWESEGATVYRPGENLGVAASWNYACRWAWGREHDAILLLNDDLMLGDSMTLARFLAAIRAEPRQVYCLAGCDYSAVCITKVVWDAAGPFDEGFWPAYYEDEDMRWRMRLVGIPEVAIDLPFEHARSTSIRADMRMAYLNTIAFGINKSRYFDKWGGLPGSEVHTQPWDGGPPWRPVRELLEQTYGTVWKG